MVKQNVYNADVFRSKGLGGWRQLYLKIIKHMNASSVIEFGAGDPDLLKNMPGHIAQKQAIDGTENYQKIFDEANIPLDVHDLNSPNYQFKQQYDIAVCSDVFEHLIQPQISLEMIRHGLTETGVLFAHVPNEFSYKKTLRAMLGKEEAIYSHPHCEEYNHPHLHRFTDIGFRKFLSLQFAHLIKITDLRYSGRARFIKSMGMKVPYCFEGGPTYICTNNNNTANSVREIKSKLMGSH